MLMLCSFAVATAEFVLVGLLPQIASDLAVSVPAAGQLVTVYMLVVTVGGPAATILTRRMSRRGLLVATMALAVGSAALSAFADSYGVLLAARVGSALAQALFLAVASEVAMAAVSPERQTAAVARVFSGFALATVLGLPLGSLVGQAYGWHATFVVVATLAGAGLIGVLMLCPAIATADVGSVAYSVRSLLSRLVLRGLFITLLALTGFVAVFTYITPMLRSVSGFSPSWVSVALAGYGLGTIAGNVLAGRVAPTSVLKLLPLPVGVLALVLLGQGVLLRYQPLALTSVIILGGAAFMIVPLVQAWLMGRVMPQTAGLVASINISVAGVAGALGAALGGVVLAAGLSPAWISLLAAAPVLAATVVALDLRRRVAEQSGPISPAASNVEPKANPAR